MAFKSRTTKSNVPPSPDLLFRDLTRRKFPDVLPHQQSMMQRYASDAIDKPDVALQLPTGSGKTLVGLLIAEWRRRKNNEKVVYLCPTKQLVHQAVEQAEKRYGLSVIGFTGRNKDYSPSDVAKYRQGMSVAVTTYSSVFNTHPFFDDADIIIIDDAHAAENYVSTLWSLEIDASDSNHKAIHAALSNLLKGHLDSGCYAKLTGKWESPADKAWVDKLPTPTLLEIKDELIELLDEYTTDSNLKFPWSMLRSHLHACHLYLSSKSILLRPLLPPTWAHPSFTNAKQRIYMSATLGEGGDLERLVGRKNIFRLPTPDGWDRQGVGRRFFMFPSLSLDTDLSSKFNIDLFKKTPRSLVLVPSTHQCKQVIEAVNEKSKLETFSVDDIETSKQDFIESQGGVAVIANRYDGIDFPGDECRLLVIEGLPKTVNLQEQFLMSRIGANILFNERIQTRVLQAIGRCTRSLMDYSAVVVTGNELADYLADPTRRNYLHPELQAELEFGVEQSIDASYDDFLENFDIFIDNGEDWEGVNEQIVEIRKEKVKTQFPAIDKLSECVSNEIDYVTALWAKDYEEALGHSEAILGILTLPELRGYRAHWEYLAGSAAHLASETGAAQLQLKAKEHYGRAKKAARDIPWLVGLSNYLAQNAVQTYDDEVNQYVMMQVERLECLFESIGTMHDRKLVKIEKKILEGIDSKNNFEEAHRLIGEHIGFDARKEEVDASPDPWWQIGNLCFVFEDHANAESDTLHATKARQVATHPNWIRENVEACSGDNIKIIPILLSPVTKVKSGGFPHITDVSYWSLTEFKQWVKDTVAIIRELYRTFVNVGDLTWRAQAADKLITAKLDVKSLEKYFESSLCKNILEVVN
jgi:Rad3-related DNA helicase